MSGLVRNSIAKLRQDIAGGAATHESVVQASLDGAAAPVAASVFTRLYPDAALAAARHADAASAAGVQLAALAGLPVSIKDLYDVAGEATASGSVICANDAPAAADAPVVERLRRAGAAIVGKTNMTEFAFSGVGINPHHGTPRNPSDASVARIPGGSSSGAAVSVALGLAVAGLGSDTGGSIRIPAALCGLVGFKSTQSRTTLAGTFPLSGTLDTVCSMAHGVADCIAVDAVIADSPLAVRPRDIRGMRFAVPRTLVFDGVEPAVAAAFDRAIATLNEAGATIVDLPLAEFAEIAAIGSPVGLSAIEGAAIHAERLATQSDRMDPRVAARMKTGLPVAASAYLAMLRARQQWIARVERQLTGFDAFLCPTVPLVAQPTEALLASDAEFFRVNGLMLRNPSVVNFLDGCSFSLPCQAAGELPVGLMVSSVRGDDAALAGVALAVEGAIAASAR
ncbi:amidase [Xylophilus sp. GOD-11R]|uniref:amidase n=1 Tax=Xylophilus sp. GOD-11R TaxID=3089814 RepID=UPI00298C5DB2|nr:amidase [Xylophilus sp. GOD-11R]WPB57258.1 amidase [Xylophilus sp. GOD-11R]